MAQPAAGLARPQACPCNTCFRAVGVAALADCAGTVVPVADRHSPAVAFRPHRAVFQGDDAPADDRLALADVRCVHAGRHRCGRKTVASRGCFPGYGLWAFLALMVASIVSGTSYDLHARLGVLFATVVKVLAGRSWEADGERAALFGPVARAGLLFGVRAAQPLVWRRRGTLSALWHRTPSAQDGQPGADLGAVDRRLRRAYSCQRSADHHHQFLFGVQADTIMSGVAYFWHEGAYDLAIVMPSAKCFRAAPQTAGANLSRLFRAAAHALGAVATHAAVQNGGIHRQMVDARHHLVVALLAQLVQFFFALASIDPGPGAIAFCHRCGNNHVCRDVV